MFNLFINPIIEMKHKSKNGYQLENGVKVGIVAFADNIALVNSISRDWKIHGTCWPSSVQTVVSG